MRLVYFADPLCSWCYGFGPELAKLLAAHGDATLELVMGGLRPFNREPVTAEFRAMLRGHWKHVAEASGLPFAPAALEIPGFTYDTEPACRAVVAARAIEPAGALACMKAIQAAFYRDARDPTRPEILAECAAEAGYERTVFLAAMESAAARQATLEDFGRSQALGVRGFPTLAAARDSQLHLVTSGFVPAAVLEERLAQIARAPGAS
jgi:putative protein-disulfide isomerase